MARNINGGTDAVSWDSSFASGAASMGVAMWIRTTQTTTNALPFGIWDNGSKGGCAFLLNNTANKISMYGKDTAGAQRFLKPSSTTINTGTWFHVAMTWINNGTAYLYVNGVQENSEVFSSSMTVATVAPPTIGDQVDTFWPTFVGDIAELAIWADTTPAVDQIEAMAKGYSPALIGHRNGKFLYAPLVRDARAVWQTQGSGDATVTGTTVSDHPRVFGGGI